MTPPADSSQTAAGSTVPVLSNGSASPAATPAPQLAQASIAVPGPQVLEAAPDSRDLIALLVIIPSILAVIIISVLVISCSPNRDRERATANVMNATLPLYGTWVGTILAFYFSRNAFEAASSATTRNAATFQQLASTTTASSPPPPENVLARISVKSLANNLLFSESDTSKLLKDVLADLQKASRYRMIVVEASTKQYIGLVHRRTAEAYLATPGQARTTGTTTSNPTLQTYLDWLKGDGATAVSNVTFLPETATLADVEAKFKETKLKDAIVTTDGTADRPVVVYINDNDINEYRGA